MLTEACSKNSPRKGRRIPDEMRDQFDDQSQDQRFPPLRQEPNSNVCWNRVQIEGSALGNSGANAADSSDLPPPLPVITFNADINGRPASSATVRMIKRMNQAWQEIAAEDADENQWTARLKRGKKNWEGQHQSNTAFAANFGYSHLLAGVGCVDGSDGHAGSGTNNSNDDISNNNDDNIYSSGHVDPATVQNPAPSLVIYRLHRRYLELAFVEEGRGMIV